jgi:hypothetical protein
MSELSLTIFNTFNFLKHQSTLDWSEFSAASHRTRKLQGFLYHSEEKNSRYKNRNAAKLKNNTNNCGGNVVVAQANAI